MPVIPVLVVGVLPLTFSGWIRSISDYGYPRLVIAIRIGKTASHKQVIDGITQVGPFITIKDVLEILTDDIFINRGQAGIRGHCRRIVDRNRINHHLYCTDGLGSGVIFRNYGKST